MAFQFKLPDVGEGIHEGKLVKWLLDEGAEVKADQPVVEVETDKAVVEIPSPKAGTLIKQHSKVGDVVKVGEVLFELGEKGEQSNYVATKTELPAATVQKSQPPAPKIPTPLVSLPSPALSSEGGKVLATPATRKFASDMGVGIEQVKGSGPGGRVTIDDVKAYAASGSGKAGGAASAAGGAGAATYASAPMSSASSEVHEDFGPVERMKISGHRRAIGERMRKSVYTMPHVTHMEEADVTWLVQVRERAKADAAAKGVKLTYLPFIIKAALGALKEFPQFNARFDEATQELVLRKYYNIGLAVDTDEGLTVPVIKDADKKDLLALAEEITRLSDEARTRKLKLEEMRGGTFTITNIGSVGGVYATPIINYPEIAILGVMKIKERPVIVEKMVESRKIMTLVLSYDHAMIDGGVAARFMNAVVKRLEDPTLL
ncbi:MAG: dihydrolipoamide acetyltransferase family protein [Candidatus Burarchaeum sp.]|nr:dihydrolipoamide acetyltransferase family protein [Candidatus Burarchaeum sp.]MDO8340074.1 dihydrolipoamide acetyltransferase family protein [Candidatus Burarchaeum sp.]